MQIFATNKCPIESAKFLWKSPIRARKMITETQQILACCEFHLYGRTNLTKVTGEIYATPKSRINHPVVIWARSDERNASWVLRHLCALYELYEGDAFQNVMDNIINKCSIPINLPEPTNFCNFAKADAKQLDYRHITDVHEAYREFLNIQLR